MERLPAEVCVHVLTFVPPRDIFLNVSLVCRKWHECTRVPGLFRFLLNGLPLYRDQVEAKRIIPASITDWEGYYKKLISEALSWMERTDESKGFREPKYFPALRFAVSKSNVWDTDKVYASPQGFHCATLDEFFSYIATRGSIERAGFVYYDSEGWEGYKWKGIERQAFVFQDTPKNRTWLHAGRTVPTGTCREEVLRLESDIIKGTVPFAGIVCIKNGWNLSLSLTG